MPQTKSAKKALKKSVRNRKFNIYYLRRIRKLKTQLRKVAKLQSCKVAKLQSYKVAKLQSGKVSKLQKGKEEAKSILSQLYKYIDKAIKEKVIHKNKGRRLKSQAAKLIPPKGDFRRLYPPKSGFQKASKKSPVLKNKSSLGRKRKK